LVPGGERRCSVVCGCYPPNLGVGLS
jgi:hypothetical protein